MSAMYAALTANSLHTPPRSAAEATELTKIYGEGDTRVVALDSVSVGFEQGRFTAIMGPSGSGKSTLMHCMAGLDSISAGSARVGENELSGLNDSALTRLRRDKIGFVFQAFNLLPTLLVNTLYESIYFFQQWQANQRRADQLTQASTQAQLDALPTTAKTLEDALAQARVRDAQIAKAAEGATYAGEADPYRHDEDTGEADEDDEQTADQGPARDAEGL